MNKAWESSASQEHDKVNCGDSIVIQLGWLNNTSSSRRSNLAPQAVNSFFADSGFEPGLTGGWALFLPCPRVYLHFNRFNFQERTPQKWLGLGECFCHWCLSCGEPIGEKTREVHQGLPSLAGQGKLGQAEPRGRKLWISWEPGVSWSCEGALDETMLRLLGSEQYGQVNTECLGE